MEHLQKVIKGAHRSAYSYEQKKNIGSEKRVYMTYTATATDDYVNNLYQTIGIESPPQLNAEVIASRLGLTVARLPVSSIRINDNIYLDNRLPSTVQWEQFGHELCHALWHPENQLHLSQSFIDLQENQANNFAYYACIPTSMLLHMKLPDTLQEATRILCATFNVTPAFAMKRLEAHIAKMYQTTP